MTIEAGPTKAFFVSMLTRDIDLDDAILDLIDNSYDGVLRKTKETNYENFDSFFVKITIKKNKFIIEDNCGGIPRDIAEKYAFRLGRPSNESQSDIDVPTVGMYGIGMKRALFKIGKNIQVITNNIAHHYQVSINENWLNEDNNWKLELEDLTESLYSPQGTKIIIQNLHAGISQKFDNESTFISELTEKISSHYSFILKKGLKISINGQDIVYKDFSLLYSEHIHPYIFEAHFRGVDIKIITGLKGAAPSFEEDNEAAEKTYNKDTNAGCTIMCNDRIVLYADRTRLTGWGDQLPQFHYQFNNIVCIVDLKSNNPNLLPVTTTKRGIDTSSEVFLFIRKYIIQGLAKFVTHTNKWKNLRDVEKTEYINKAQKLSLQDIKIKISDLTLRAVPGQSEAMYYLPNNLPLPPKEESIFSTIKFSKPKKDIQYIAEELALGSSEPSRIGTYCFDKILLDLQKGM